MLKIPPEYIPIIKENLRKNHKPETWRQFYTRLYGFQPDWITFSPHPHWDEVHNPPDIAGIIKEEEEKFCKLYEKNKKLILTKFNDITKLDGETLSMLHHTYGCDPSTVEAILNTILPERLHTEYRIAYLQHRQTGAKICQ
jgi:alanyl-tRNA synthetase